MPVRCVQYLVCCGSLLFMMSSPHSTAQSIRRSIALACCANQLRQLRTKKKHSSQGCSNGYIPGEVENCMQIFSYKSMRYHFRAVNSADICCHPDVNAPLPCANSGTGLVPLQCCHYCVRHDQQCRLTLCGVIATRENASSFPQYYVPRPEIIGFVAPK